MSHNGNLSSLQNPAIPSINLKTKISKRIIFFYYSLMPSYKKKYYLMFAFRDYQSDVAIDISWQHLIIAYISSTLKIFSLLELSTTYLAWWWAGLTKGLAKVFKNSRYRQIHIRWIPQDHWNLSHLGDFPLRRTK